MAQSRTLGWWLASGFALTATTMFLPVLVSPTISHGPDAATHIFNSELYRAEMEAGVLYPRWLGEWYGGFGAPIGVAYSPLTYLVAGAVANLGLGTLPAVKLVLWTSVFLSGLFMFAFSRRILSTGGAVVAGLAYMVTPYRVIDLFGRTAFPEAVAFIWLPLISLFLFDTIFSRSRTAHLHLGLCSGLLILTHSMIAYLTFLVIALVIFGMLIFAKNIDRIVIFELCISGIFSLGISAIYWIPAICERQFLNTQWFSESGVIWGNFRNNFVLNAEIYRGTKYHNIFIENFTIGIVVALFLALCVFVVRKILMVGTLKESPNNAITLTMFGILIVSLFMTMKFSAFVWKILPFSKVIAFPWRWMTISSFVASFLVGDILGWHQKELKKSQRKVDLIAILYWCLLLALVFYSVVLVFYHRGQIDPRTANRILNERPLPADLFGWVYDKPFLPIWSREFDYEEASRRSQAKVFVKNGVSVDVERWESVFRRFVVDADDGSMAAVRTFWYPGWRIRVNGGEETAAGRSEQGLVLVELPEGKTEIELEFDDTAARWAGSRLSVVFGLLWLIWVGWATRKWRASLVDSQGEYGKT